MGKLSDFFHPVRQDEKQEIIVSDRFVQHGDDGAVVLDEKGTPIPAPFIIRPVSEEMNAAIRKGCTRSHRDRSGMLVQDFDVNAYTARIVIAGTVEPDFAAAEMCSAYGVINPEDVPRKMLYSGEYRRLSDAIMDLSGFGDDIQEEAKNS